MAQGEATKEEAKEVEKIFAEVFNALPKRRVPEFLNHANDIYLFLSDCQRVLPNEKK